MTRDIAQRLVNADNEFIDCIIDQGYTEAEAVTIFGVFRQEKVIKLAAGIGRWNVTHGAFWEKAVMDNALKLGSN